METTITDINDTEKEIKVNLPFGEFEKFVKQSEDNAIKEIEVKGFRKGQAPRETALSKIDGQKLLADAADKALKEVYPKIIKENNLEPLGMPEIQVLKLAPKNDFEFKAKIAVLAKIDLPDYKEIAKQVERKEVFVGKEDIENAYKQLKEMKDKIPEEQIKQINFDNPEELKKILQKDLKLQKEMIEKQRVRNEILMKIVEKADFKVPEPLIETEFRKTIENIKSNISQAMEMTFEDYLKKINKTEQELEQDLKKDIKNRIKRALLLKEIQEKENIKATQDEIKKEVDLFKANFSKDKNQEEIDDISLSSYFEERIEQEKTLQLLESFTLISKIIKP
ncbi:hypothetical protein KKC63_00940 [Patescibacteria group bacterium]|nr:hypothetical protein [Patescibacteria group bacterium]